MMLQNLVVDGLRMYDHEEDVGVERVILSKLDVVDVCQIKSLSLEYVNIRGTNEILEKCNLLIQFILKSCPLLENFKLYGRGNAHGVLNLDFREHAQMDRVLVHMEGCRYYNFLGKQWKHTSKHILKEEDISGEEQENLPYYINLAWMDKKVIKLELVEYKVSLTIFLENYINSNTLITLGYNISIAMYITK